MRLREKQKIIKLFTGEWYSWQLAKASKRLLGFQLADWEVEIVIRDYINGKFKLPAKRKDGV